MLSGRELRRIFMAFIVLLPAPAIFLTGCAKNSGVNADPPAKPTRTAPAHFNVLTYHNDNFRTGEDLSETVLTPANVNPSKFGKVAFLEVQGLVDAEPLYVSDVPIAGARHNVVFIATEHDLVYAFDADSYTPLWRVSLLGDGETTSGKRDCDQINPEIGITATPVIDLSVGPHGAIDVIAMSRDHKHHYFQRLHALDLATGAELPGSPRVIEATFPGHGAGSKNGHVIFDPRQYEDRAALLLAHGVIYTTWSSHCDHEPYNGWVIAYDSASLQPAGVLNLTPNGTDGGIWMTGDGPAEDESGNIHLLTGNGTFDPQLDSRQFPVRADFGNAFVKISRNGGTLAVSDYFTMHDTVAESGRDEDIGSGGILLLPDVKDDSGKVHHLAIGAGKDQIIYVVDRDSMGKFDRHDAGIYQKIPGALGGGVFSKPSYFNGTVYYCAYMNTLKAFPVTNGKLATTPASQTAETFGYPGTTPAISANGNSNGIVWAVQNGYSGILRAYDAGDLSKEIYNSEQSGVRDKFTDNKFITPMIASGKVFVGTPTGVAIFGLLP